MMRGVVVSRPTKVDLGMIGVALLFPALTWGLWESENPILHNVAEVSFLLFYFLSFAVGGIGLLILTFSQIGWWMKRRGSKTK